MSAGSQSADEKSPKAAVTRRPSKCPPSIKLTAEKAFDTVFEAAQFLPGHVFNDSEVAVLVQKAMKEAERLFELEKEAKPAKRANREEK